MRRSDRKRRRVTADDVVAYLEKDWIAWVFPDRRCYVRHRWDPFLGTHMTDEVPSPREHGRRLLKVVERIAEIEGRATAEVLADIAAMERPTGGRETVRPEERVVPPGRHGRGKRRKR